MDIDPDTSVGFLVSDIARLMRSQFNAGAQSVGLTLAQARAMAHLARNEGISQAALAEILEIQPITLLRQLDRLSDAGLIERRPNPSDRRAQQLFLTPAAQPLLERIVRLGRELAARALVGVDGPEVIAVLQRMRQNLTEAPVQEDTAGRPLAEG